MTSKTRPLRISRALAMPLFIAVGLSACSNDSNQPTASDPAPSIEATPVATITPANVDGQRIIQADSEPGNWMSHGRTYNEQRYSPLADINSENVDRLGLGWRYDFDTKRGLEATPIVVDGIMYVTGSWSRVYALNAASGELLWEYNPQVAGKVAAKACCDVVNRGVAVWQGVVYFGALDGRLIALDANDGSVIWSVQTTPTDKAYTITGAPRVVKGKVIIGNGGGEFGVRGFVSAYDAKTGDMVWRFYTVPGDPAEPFESPELEMAAKTWSGGEWWKRGGGGTVWDSMSYDAELDLLYVGVGNGSPWSRKLRSPGGGDNLFLSSIVAVRPDTGEYVWHYQTTPGDSWDYTAAQQMILADLEINGELRKVIMQAPKNGFFYVLDRASGEFISAKPFVPVTWASGIDPESGRPVMNPDAFYGSEKPVLQLPSPFGGHNWHSMSFHKDTGLVYIPAMNIGFPYHLDDNFTFENVGVNLGINGLTAAWPTDKVIRKTIRDSMKGQLVAWDPVKQEPAWQVEHKVSWNGGVVSTAGNLIFQGNGEGNLVAYAADTGEQLWSSYAQTGIVAAPITYTVDGEQYVAVLAGWGGIMPLLLGGAVEEAANNNVSRILVYKLDGNASLPTEQEVVKVLDPPANTASAETIELGRKLYHDSCFACHGDTATSVGVVPDLRYTPQAKHTIWDKIVLDGILQGTGMVSFADRVTPEGSKAIQAYVIKRAHDLKANLEQEQSQ